MLFIYSLSQLFWDGGTDTNYQSYYFTGNSNINFRYFRKMQGPLSSLQKKFKKLLSDPFWKNAGNLFSGTAIGQALPILIFPLLTRIYPKEIFDVYFIYSGIILLTRIISTLQYQFALLIPKKNSEARTLLVINGGISIIISTLLLLVLLAMQPFLNRVVENQYLVSWLYYVPLSTFFLGIFECFMYYLNRLQRYSFITYGKITKGAVLVIAQSAFGILGFSTDGLLHGLVIAQGISALIMIVFTLHSDPQCFVFSRSNIPVLMRRYKDMPLFNTLISFVNNLSNQLPVFILTKFYGSGASGDYGMANKIVNTPMGMISHSVGQVFYREISDIMHSGRNLRNFVKSMYRNMFRIGIVPFAVLFITAPWLFDWVLSDAYQSTGYMAQVLVPFFFISFMNNPMTGLLTMLNYQKAGAIYQAALLAARIMALGAGILLFDHVLITVGLFSAVSVVMNVFLYCYLMKLARNARSKYYD